jgi:hypothetical protein
MKTIIAQQPLPQPPSHFAPAVQDIAAIGGLLVPLVIAIGFFFTMRAKLEELDKNISTQGEMTLLKIENKFVVLSEKIVVFHQELVEQDTQIKEIKKELEFQIRDLKKEVDRQKEARADILRQLSGMGIDLYVVGEKDRRKKVTD